MLFCRLALKLLKKQFTQTLILLSLFIHSHVNPNPYDIVELLGQYTYFFYTLKVNGDQNAKKMSTMTKKTIILTCKLKLNRNINIYCVCVYILYIYIYIYIYTLYI